MKQIIGLIGAIFASIGIIVGTLVVPTFIGGFVMAVYQICNITFTIVAIKTGVLFAIGLVFVILGAILTRLSK